MTTPQWITRELLDEVSAEAAASPRRRRNRNLHQMEDPVHRLLNAMEPGTYVRPHRHIDPPKTETAVVLSGRIGLLVFDEAGAVVVARVLSELGDTRGVDIPAGLWHAFVALEPGSVFFEAKAGPYVAPAGSEVAAWAPEEGTPEAAHLEAEWRRLLDA